MTGIPEIKPYKMPALADLPSNVAHWKIDPNRAVLLVHDMQEYFVRKIPTSDLRSELLNNIMLVSERCRTLNIPVSYTTQPGDMTLKQRGLLVDFWGKGMKVDPIDRHVVSVLAPSQDDWLCTKWRYSAFYQSDLLERMHQTGRDQIIICGVYAHIGILTTALDAFSHDVETFIIADAVADFSEVHHFMALQHAAQCCAVIVSTKQVLLAKS